MANSAPPQPTRPATPRNNGSHLGEPKNGSIAELTNVIDRRVARRIRTQRLKTGKTLQALAQDIGVAFQQAHKYERGQSRISAGRLFHIARALGAPIAYFFLPDDEAKALDDRTVADGRKGAPHGLQAASFLGDRRGATAVLFAVTMTTLLGFAGLGVDVGIWYALKREYQSAADNAALSGALEIAQNKGIYDPGNIYNSIGCTSACSFPTDIQTMAMYAASNDLPSGAASLSIDSRSSNAAPTGCVDPAVNTICVNNPPTLGPHTLANDPDRAGNYVEVILAEPSLSTFPALVGYTTAPVIRTRAVAGVTSQVPSCFIALGYPYGTGNTLSIGGGGSNVNLQIPNCAFVSASTSPASATTSASIYLNGGITINAGAVSTSGGYVIKGNSASVKPPIVPNVLPQFTDPYCDATQPTSACPTGAGGGVQITLATYPWSSGTPTPADPANPCKSVTSGTATLVPGYYGGSCAGNATAPLNISGGTTSLCPGVYYLDGETTSGSVKGAALIVSGNGTTVNLGTAGAGVCPANGLDGVTFIASCSTASCHSGGGLSLGGQGSNTPTINLSPPSTSPVSGVPPKIFFHQVYNTADTSTSPGGNSSFGTILGSGLNGVVHVPATAITLNGGTNFGSCIELIAAAYIFSGGATLDRVSTCNLQVDYAKTIALVE